jgi:hypothetical protein
MNDKLLDHIANSIKSEVEETLPSFNKYLKDNAKPKTRFETTVNLLVIKIVCEKALKKLNQDNNEITNKIVENTEKLINDITDNILIEEKVNK